MSAFPIDLSQHLEIAIPIAIFLAIGVAIKTLRGAMDFHYDYFTRRKLKHISDLEQLVESGSPADSFLKQTKESEVFRIAAGVNVTRHRASALMHLCEFKRIGPNQVKTFAQYVTTNENGKVDLIINWMDKFAAYFSMGGCIVFLVLGISAIVTSLMDERRFAWLGGCFLFLVCCVVGGWLLKDYYRFRTVKQVKKELEAHPLPPCKEGGIIKAEPVIELPNSVH